MQNVFFQGPIYWEKRSCFSHRKLLLYLKSVFCITRLCLCMVCAGQSGLVFCDASVSWRGFMCVALWLKCIVGHCCRRMSDCILDTIAAFKVAHTHTHKTPVEIKITWPTFQLQTSSSEQIHLNTLPHELNTVDLTQLHQNLHHLSKYWNVTDAKDKQGE